MRLDKFLAQSQIGTRKIVREYVKDGLVKINGITIFEPAVEINEIEDIIEYNGQITEYKEKVYYMFNKPSGCITARKDADDKTVFDYFKEINMDGVFHVGRLDKDTEGLLLLTDDGMLAHELLSPRKHVDKVYFAKVSGQFGENEIARFKEGLDIGNGERSKQARLQILKADVQESEVLITIMEGKFHQVKRMVKAVGSEVLYLKRLSMGSLKLDEELKLGEYRRLTKAELQELKEHRR